MATQSARATEISNPDDLSVSDLTNVFDDEWEIFEPRFEMTVSIEEREEDFYCVRLTHLWIDEEHRRCGWATALMDAMYDLIDQETNEGSVHINASIQQSDGTIDFLTDQGFENICVFGNETEVVQATKSL